MFRVQSFLTLAMKDLVELIYILFYGLNIYMNKFRWDEVDIFLKKFP